MAAKPSFLGLVEVQKDVRGSPEQRRVEERRLVDLDGRGGGRFGSVCRTQFVTPAQNAVAGSIVRSVQPPPPKELAPKLHMAPYGWGPEPPVANVAVGSIRMPDHNF